MEKYELLTSCHVVTHLIMFPDLFIGFILLSIFDWTKCQQTESQEEDQSDLNVKKLLEQNTTNDNLILISYLTAVSRVPKSMEAMLKVLSESSMKYSDSSSDHEKYSNSIHSLSNCFRKDFDGSMISGALQVAINEINDDPTLLPNHKLTYIFDNTCGSEMSSTKFFMSHWKRGARVFIGPEMNCRTEATMAAAQNLPIISYKCKDQTVSDKKKYNTFARTVPAETEITKAFIALFEQYSWRKFTIIYEDQTTNEEMYQAIRRAIDYENSLIKDNGPRYTIVNVSKIAMFSEIKSEKMIDYVIDETRLITRCGLDLYFLKYNLFVS
uniref:ANF_receptor domain-containing protein n=1 Tax=Heterorhabditis bacteriophora TaxID=37862 RepID=A0A1I7X9L4_HETBA